MRTAAATLSALVLWPLTIPVRLARALRPLWRRFVDLGRILRGLATRDAPRTEFLFTGIGLRMLLTCPGHVEDELVRLGVWEPHVTAALRFFAQPGATFVDVGANIGYHAVSVASACAGARVICFEPNPFVRADLVRNVALNPDVSIEVRDCALGDRTGTVELHAQTRRAYNRGASSVFRNYNVGARYQKIAVELRTLDEELADTRVDLIKIDTEGFESAVLRGARKLIARCRPVVVFEFDSRFLVDPRAELAAIREVLDGYTLYTLGPERTELGRFDDRAVASRFFGADLVAIPGETSR
jgi:FkbM family methyltransferase